jgi:hypothetical protein
MKSKEAFVITDKAAKALEGVEQVIADEELYRLPYMDKPLLRDFEARDNAVCGVL